MSQITDQLAENIPLELQPTEWIDAVHVGFQHDIVVFLLCAYGFLLLATVIIIFLQGFHSGGFNLDAGFLKWLGAATVGQIGGLLILTVRVVSR